MVVAVECTGKGDRLASDCIAVGVAAHVNIRHQLVVLVPKALD